MNKIFYRTKLNGFLMSDSDLKVESALYPPYVEDGGLDIGNNDPLIKGAIASKDIDGVPCLFIYQGLDIDDNQIWQQVGENAPSSPYIKLWESGDSIKINKYVTHPIEGNEYLFRSNIDNNTVEPTLDFDDANWELVGIKIDDAVESSTSTWSSEKIAAEIIASGVATLTFDESDLLEESWSTIDDPAYYLPFDPGLLEPASIKYKITSETATNRIDISNIVQDTTLTPNFRVGGFTSNDPQTITIKLI